MPNTRNILNANSCEKLMYTTNLYSGKNAGKVFRCMPLRINVNIKEYLNTDNYKRYFFYTCVSKFRKHQKFLYLIVVYPKLRHFLFPSFKMIVNIDIVCDFHGF